jgi:hypothetical protein
MSDTTPDLRVTQVFDMRPDDVVLIGGVTGGREAIQHFVEWAQAEWPDRRVVCFADDIDVRLLSEVRVSASRAVYGPCAKCGEFYALREDDTPWPHKYRGTDISCGGEGTKVPDLYDMVYIRRAADGGDRRG